MNINDSKRLSYRLMGENDAHLLCELDQDPLVMKYINGGKPNTLETIKNTFIPRLLQFTDDEKGWGLWQVNTLKDNQFIGWILVRPMDFFTEQRRDDILELGWRFKQLSWGKGYATEAADHIASHLTLNSSYSAFSATALIDNKGSINVMKKLNMQYIKQYIYRDERGDHDAVLYSRKL